MKNLAFGFLLAALAMTSVLADEPADETTAGYSPRYRNGFSENLTMSPGEICEVHLNLHVTSNYFGSGHRIRLEVSSSNFPRWDRNLNTGGNNYDETEWEIARNTVHHSKDHPSYIVLPVIE